MQKVFTSNKIEKAKCQNALRIKGLWHFFASNILLQKTRFSKCQKHFWTEKSEIFARKLKKQNKTGYKKPLKTLGFSRVKVAQEEGFEPPCLLGKRFSRPPRCDRFDIPAYYNARCRIMISSPIPKWLVKLVSRISFAYPAQTRQARL